MPDLDALLSCHTPAKSEPPAHGSKEELLYLKVQPPLRGLGFILRREAETRHLDHD